jgi:hypothetical protein
MHSAAHPITFTPSHVFSGVAQRMQRRSCVLDPGIGIVVQIRFKLDATYQLPLGVRAGAVHFELTVDNSNHEMAL